MLSILREIIMWTVQLHIIVRPPGTRIVQLPLIFQQYRFETGNTTYIGFLLLDSALHHHCTGTASVGKCRYSEIEIEKHRHS